MYILKQITKHVKYMIAESRWKHCNKHNFTTLHENSSLEISRVSIGKGTYGKIDFETFHDVNACLKIGSYCSIGPSVKFLLAGEHYYNKLSTYPFRFRYLHGECETFSKGDIIIKDDVWIGYGTIILSGVTIGQGAVIGAGSVVRKDIPPYSIYCNEVIKKYRFDNEVIEALNKFDFSLLNKEDIISESQNLYLNVFDFCNTDFYYGRCKKRGDSMRI